jgi:V/A-type H+-transporting ATPase subunit I
MAVVPMQKIQLLIHRSDIDAALLEIQRLGAVEFHEVLHDQTVDIETEFAFANLLPRIEHVLSFLKPYEVKRSLMETIREGTQYELTESAVRALMADTEGLEGVVRDIEKLQVEFAEKTEAIRALEERKEWLIKWSALPLKLNELETKLTKTHLLEAKSEQTTATILEADLREATVPALVSQVAPGLISLTLEKSVDWSGVQTVLEKLEIETVNPVSATETPEVELTATEEQLAAATSQVAWAYDQAEYFAKEHLKRLHIAAEVLGWARDRHDILQTGKATKRTALFTGWLNADAKPLLEAAFAENNIAATVTEIEPETGEEPPVDIKNHRLVQPFEAVTRLYGMPGYKDLDPTLFLAGFFFLFFGLSLTDVGYGLSLVVVSLFLLFIAKVSKTMRSVAWLLFYIGMATVLVGALFGGYLGVDPSLLPAPLQAIQLFDPIGNPLPVFYLALALGVVQVMVGMMLKIYSEARNDRLFDGVLGQGPWLFLFTIGIIYVGVATGFTDILSVPQIKNLALVGVVLVLITGAREPGNILQKIISSFANLYAGVGYFSDILSYSRLLALGLATSALAFAVNLIAGMVIGVPYVGIILAAAILIAGHLFTLIINTLGAFVHSARLQFVEFFGKFIAGTGKDFTPLYRKETYVTIRDD